MVSAIDLSQAPMTTAHFLFAATAGNSNFRFGY